MTDFKDSLNLSIKNLLDDLAKGFGFNQVEIGPLGTPLTFEFYEKWLSQNYYGSMTYLESHAPFKKNPLKLDDRLRSVITVAQSYYPAILPHPVKIPARTALYSQNQDYHRWLKEKLKDLILELKKSFPDNVFLPYVDSGPVLERGLAYQNKLGWFGKNTCLIHPEHGSLFFLAEILTDVEIEPNDINFAPLPDFCGNCQKCIDICPTGALIEPRILKADQCISYLTIEAKDTPPPELRKKIGDWFFGCDLCQTSCPWNEKFFRKQKIETSDNTSTAPLLNLNSESRIEIVNYFRFLLTTSNKQIQKFHFGSPLSRAGAKGLKRNALIVIANQNLVELEPEVRNLASVELIELKKWTLEQIKMKK